MTDLSVRRPLCSLRVAFGIALAAAFLWLIPRLAILHVTGPPDPWLVDELSYLLSADTFLHGRLANPSPEMSRFFESPEILTSPTYASKYPPAQGLWLALGEKTFGTPLAGVILEGFAMVFSMSLMFSAWVSWRWAVAFSAVAPLCFQWPFYWANSYWGGCAAAVGAALLLFAVGCFRNNLSNWAWGAIFSAGLLMLFLSRPYEGTVFAAAISVTLLWRLLKLQQMRKVIPFALAALPILLAGAWWTTRYDRAITGNPLQSPYVLYEQKYGTNPLFWFMPLRAEPHYEYPRMVGLEGLHGYNVGTYHEARLVMRRLGGFTKVLVMLVRVLGPLFVLAMLSALAWRDDRCRVLIPVALAGYLASCLVVAKYPHYFAPLMMALLLLAACTADTGVTASRRRWCAPALLILSAIWSLGVTGRGLARARELYPRQQRSLMIEECLKNPGKQLVLVHYDKTAPPDLEWVYNSAEPDSQKVLLAHDLGPVEDALIASRYPDRIVRTVEVSMTSSYDLRYRLHAGLP